MTAVTVTETYTQVEVDGGQIVTVPGPDTISVVSAAVQGPTGPTGATGPTGPAGADGSGDAFYTHNQLVPAAIWTIAHNLNKHPSITVVDSTGREVIGDPVYVDANTITVTFSSGFAGKAYVN